MSYYLRMINDTIDHRKKEYPKLISDEEKYIEDLEKLKNNITLEMTL